MHKRNVRKSIPASKACESGIPIEMEFEASFRKLDTLNFSRKDHA
jgi:hypothetical protein